MKWSLDCKVKSKIKIAHEIKFNHNDKEYVFYPNSNGFLEGIKIIVKVEHPEKFYSKIDENEKPVKITIESDKELYNALIKEFWELESIMAFSAGVRKINWENPEMKVICETPEEKANVKVFGVSWNKEYPDPERPMDEETLKEMVVSKDKYSSLTVIKSFWREGMNEFNSFRFIESFFNFYFVIEGLYGNGKTKNNNVKKELKKSSEFLSNLKNNMDEFAKPLFREHFDKVKEMLSKMSKNYDSDGMICLIIKIRGVLHHFAKGSKLTQGTPFNQKDFNSIAFFLLGLSTLSILMKIVEINNP